MRHPKISFGLPPRSLFTFPPVYDPPAIPPPPSFDHTALRPTDANLLVATHAPNHHHLRATSPIDIPPRIFHAFLDPKFPLIVAFLYLVVVKSWNAINRRRQGRPWAISRTRVFFWLVVAHNVFLAVYSAWTWIGITRAAARSFVAPWSTDPQLTAGGTHGWLAFIDSLTKIQGSRGLGNATLFDSSENVRSWIAPEPRSGGVLVETRTPSAFVPGRLWNEGLAFYGWWFYLSKAYEVVDTLIILLKGKQSSTLQSYHHAGALICMWTGIRYMSPPIWMFLFLNSFIHALMYTYYTITAFGVRVPKQVKRSLTTMQITQFLVGGSYAAAHLFVTYSYPEVVIREGAAAGGKTLVHTWKTVHSLTTAGQALAVWLNVLYLTPLTYLFARFFIKSYLGSSSSSSAAASAKAAAGTHKKNGTTSSSVAAASASKLAAHHTDDLSVRAPSAEENQAATDELRREAAEVRASAVEAVQAAATVTSNKDVGVRTRKAFERVKKVVDE